MKTFMLYTDADYNHKTSAAEAEVVLSGCYFHGEAESVLGNDIICVERINLSRIKYGIHDFLVYDRESMDIIVFGKLFIWDGRRYHNPHGLAIMDGDDEGMNYAKHCMEIEQDYC